MAPRDREKKVSAARRRAEQHTTGFETTVLKVPEGLSFFDFKPGVHLLDIIPYTVKKGKSVPGGNPMADKGELYFERTFFIYRKIGPEEKSYVALGKTFGKPDPIAEFRNTESKKDLTPDDAKYVKSLTPKERQIFLVYDRKNPDKGLQIMENSFHLFGKLLDSRVQNSTEEEGWDLFYFLDEDGLSLRVTVEEVDGGGFTFNEATAIDFVPRKTPVPAKIADHDIDLDSLLVEVPYDKMKAIFLGVAADDKDKEEEPEEDEVPSKGSRKSPPKEEPVDEDDEPAPKKKEAPKEDKPTKSSYAKGDAVTFEGKQYKIHKINSDSGVAVLVDSDDDFVKADVEDLKPYKPAKEVDEKVEKKSAAVKASDVGITKGMKVLYQDDIHTVFRISGDETSMILMNDDTDETVNGIGMLEVKILKQKKEAPKEDKPAKEEKAEKAEKKEEPKGKKKTEVPADDSDDNWDEDWDK